RLLPVLFYCVKCSFQASRSKFKWSNIISCTRCSSFLKVFVRANVPITATPLPEGKRPFLGGSPEQIAQDLTRVQNLKVDEVFFSAQASRTVDEAIRRLEEIRTAMHR